MSDIQLEEPHNFILPESKIKIIIAELENLPYKDVYKVIDIITSAKLLVIHEEEPEAIPREEIENIVNGEFEEDKPDDKT